MSEKIELPRPKLLWRPLQRLRAKVGLIPSAEVEIVARLMLGLQAEMQRFVAAASNANQNFLMIAKFIDATNKNAIAIDANFKVLSARLDAIEKALGREAGQGGYVQ